MAKAYIKQLKDAKEAAIYPITRVSAVYMSKGARTLENALGDVIGIDQNIKFDGSGSIIRTLSSGDIITTRFLLDGNIEETTTNSDGKVLEVKLIRFNTDGSIDITIQGED